MVVRFRGRGLVCHCYRPRPRPRLRRCRHRRHRRRAGNSLRRFREEATLADDRVTRGRESDRRGEESTHDGVRYGASASISLPYPTVASPRCFDAASTITSGTEQWNVTNSTTHSTSQGSGASWTCLAERIRPSEHGQARGPSSAVSSLKPLSAPIRR